jgi:hypothetical protein
MTGIHILHKGANERGDLFARLMSDLFVALGYGISRLNIHKSGREIDLSALHRLEQRKAIAECKATSTPIGGSDLNKFVGVLDAESDESLHTEGYFISLSGFTETAIEQELARKKTKVCLLTGEQVIDELIQGRILVSKERATEIAGRLCGTEHQFELDLNLELLVHERGLVWAVFYTQGKQRTHVALIHADGTPLAAALSKQIVDDHAAYTGTASAFICLNAWQTSKAVTAEQRVHALGLYQQYLVNECGTIQLDGLPADTDVGSRKLRLEALFVPLHLDLPRKERTRIAAGNALNEFSRIALLAAPGGGKSTLLKRIAVAYADPTRRLQIDDQLPDRKWLPLFFRCRELRGLTRSSFADLTEALCNREPVRQAADAFKREIDDALTEGRVLLLVDGLDEIGDPGDRASFVCTLRTALLAYPETAIVVTSREAGFRHVAAHLAPICTTATLSPFNEEDIRRLTVAWHVEVVGSTEKVRGDAEALAATISRNDRIHRLASNPLLLTTLLLVKRWVGSLPTRRAVLYGKAVEVLLMTWNTEGHEPIRDEEALPQLCYVAAAMMRSKVERISRPHLAALVQDARNALPTELGYVRGTVAEFIHRVEDRSSLLMMTGLDVEDGILVEFFEFRHLTFQEYLCARGMVEGWHPDRKDTDTLVTVLAPYFQEEKWREVIPLAAVLGGKATEPLIQELTAACLRASAVGPPEKPKPSLLINALGHSLADEAAARPETIGRAIEALVACGLDYETRSSVQSFLPSLMSGRYGAEVIKAARTAFADEASDFTRTTYALKEASWQVALQSHNGELNTILETAICELSRDDLYRVGEGALLVAHYLDALPRRISRLVPAELDKIVSALLRLLYSSVSAHQYAAGWALWALGRCDVWLPPTEPDVFGRIFHLCRHGSNSILRQGLAHTLVQQKLASRDTYNAFHSVDPDEILQALVGHYQELGPYERPAMLIAAYYRRTIGDEDIIRRTLELEQLKSGLQERRDAPLQIDGRLREFLALLGYQVPPDGTKVKRARTYARPDVGLISDPNQEGLL